MTPAAIEATIKLTAVAFALTLVFVTGWTVRGWAEAEGKFQLEQKLSTAKDENDKLKTELGVKHAAENQVIAGLSDELRTLRLRLPKGCVQPVPASGGGNSNAGGGEFPTSAQAAFDRFNGGLAKLARDADDMTATCRVVMEWAKAQSHK
jgi:hypothetical protein